MKKRQFILLIMIFSAFALQGQSSVAISTSAGVNVPVINSDLFNPGVAASLSGTFSLGDIPFFHLLGHLDYSFNGTPADTSLSVISLGAGADILIPLLPILDFRTAISGGYSLSLYEGNPYFNPFVKGDLQFLFNLSPSVRLGISGGYKHIFPDTFSGFSAGIGAIISLGADQGSQIELENIILDPVFPVFYKYYDENPFGSLSITNGEKGTIDNVKVSLFVKNYMDSPKEWVVKDQMEKGEQIEVPLYALFNDSVLDITEGTKVQTEISVSYNYLNRELTGDAGDPLRLYDRNAMTWDDDNKAAAFITAKDPTVLAFSKNFAGIARDRTMDGVDQNFSMAMGIYEALRMYGMNYVIDPSSAYDVLSLDATAIDYLQFPFQTLQYRAGDCDDLSILYCSLLEAAGIETAFITVPGHIYMAFALKTHREDINDYFVNSDSLIFTKDKVWVPVEVTLLDNGFVKAWESGLGQWNKFREEAGFYPVHQAWDTYEPVGFASRSADLSLPETERFTQVFNDEMDTFVQQQLQPQVNRLLEGLDGARNKAVVYNKLGVLYARYGQYERAELQFKKGAALFSPASMINLGNIYYLQEEFAQAKDTFSEALESRPRSAVSLLGLAKAEYELQLYPEAEDHYEDMVDIKPQWAAEFSYLSSSQNGETRAADQTAKKRMYWESD